jgi:DNA excision repair protein ERCC-4
MKILIDSREQKPWSFADHETEPATLTAGDYSLAGLQELIAIERKELSDIIGCITSGRDRFKRELLRLRSYRCKAVILECSMNDIINHNYRSKVTPASVIGSIASWQTRYSVPFIFAGNRTNANGYCLSMMRNYTSQIKEVIKAIEQH